MPVSLDPITRRKLILLRQIYQRAAMQSASHHSEVDGILSLISFDLVNESLLKIAISAVDSSVHVGRDLREFISTANRVFSKALSPIPQVPDAHNVKHVRKIRNSAMHDAIFPTPTDVSDCRTYTRDFLQEMVANVWGENFNSLRMTELIKDAATKDFLTTAEVELEKGKYTEAAIQAIAGFTSALEKIKSSIVGPTMFSRDIGSELYWVITSIQDVLVLPIVGLEYPNYVQFKRLTGDLGVHFMSGGGISANITGAEPSAEDASFIVNYAINSVVQIESCVGNIEKPFGYDAPFW